MPTPNNPPLPGWPTQALDTKPSEVSGQAFFVSNALNEQAITYNSYRTGLYRRRRGPAPQIISLTNYVRLQLR